MFLIYDIPHYIVNDFLLRIILCIIYSSSVERESLASWWENPCVSISLGKKQVELNPILVRLDKEALAKMSKDVKDAEHVADDLNHPHRLLPSCEFQRNNELQHDVLFCVHESHAAELPTLTFPKSVALLCSLRCSRRPPVKNRICRLTATACDCLFRSACSMVPSMICA